MKAPRRKSHVAKEWQRAMGTRPAWGRLEMVRRQNWRVKKCLGKEASLATTGGSANTGQDQREGKLLQMTSSHMTASRTNSPPSCVFLNLCWKTVFQKSIFFPEYQSWLRLVTIKSAWLAVCSPVRCGSVLQEKNPFGTLQCTVFIAIR